MKVSRDDKDFVGFQQLTFVKGNTNFAGTLLKQKAKTPPAISFPKVGGRNGFSCCSVRFPIQFYLIPLGFKMALLGSA